MKEPIRYVAEDGTVEYRLDNGDLHREDGPAIIRANGVVEYFLNDQRHREDGPAIWSESGAEKWFLHGKLHCDTGPAVTHYNGIEQYWLDGIQYDPVTYLMKCYERTN
jgi:hypothetical protein